MKMPGKDCRPFWKSAPRFFKTSKMVLKEGGRSYLPPPIGVDFSVLVGYNIDNIGKDDERESTSWEWLQRVRAGASGCQEQLRKITRELPAEPRSRLSRWYRYTRRVKALGVPAS